MKVKLVAALNLGISAMANMARPNPGCILPLRAKLFSAFLAVALHPCGNSANRFIEPSPRRWIAVWLKNDWVSLVATHGNGRGPFRFAGPSEGIAIEVLTRRPRFAGHDCETGRIQRLRKRYEL
jgi:hypothetical protein